MVLCILPKFHHSGAVKRESQGTAPEVANWELYWEQNGSRLLWDSWTETYPEFLDPVFSSTVHLVGAPDPDPASSPQPVSNGVTSPTHHSNGSLWQGLWDAHCAKVFAQQHRLFQQWLSAKQDGSQDSKETLQTPKTKFEDRSSGDGETQCPNDTESSNAGQPPGSNGEGDADKAGSPSPNSMGASTSPSAVLKSGGAENDGDDDDPPDERPVKIKRRYSVYFSFIL